MPIGRNIRPRGKTRIAFVALALILAASIAHAQCPDDSTLGQGWGAIPTGLSAYLSYSVRDPLRDETVVFEMSTIRTLATAPCAVWKSRPIAGPGPTNRMSAAVTVDSVRDRVLLFGGRRTTGSQLSNELWALSLGETPQWTRLTPTGPGPAPRMYASAIVDPVHDQLVVLGGEPVLGSDSVWTLPLSGGLVWSRHASAGPSARRSPALEWDSRHERVLYYGGQRAGFEPSSDAWSVTWDPAPHWTAIAAPTPRPVGQWPPATAYDAAGDRLLVLDEPSANPLWALSTGTSPAWSQPATTGPRPAQTRHLDFDDSPPRLVCVRGPGIDETTTMSVLDLTRMEWRRLGPAGAPVWSYLGASSFLNQFHSAVVDPATDRMVAFSDYPLGVWLPLDAPTNVTVLGSPTSNAAWGAALDEAHQRFLYWDGGPGAWQMSPATFAFSPIGVTGPAPGHSLEACAFDPRRNRLLAFGGASFDGATWTYWNDLWELVLDGTPHWNELTPGGPLPSPRITARLAIDPVEDRLWLFGGQVGSGPRMNDVWSLALGAPLAWESPAVAGTPPAGEFLDAEVMFDPGRRQYLFVDGGLLDGIAAFQLSPSPRWVQPLAEMPKLGAPVDGYLFPAPRGWQAQAFDPRRGRAIVGLGTYPGGANASDLWELRWSTSGRPGLVAGSLTAVSPGTTATLTVPLTNDSPVAQRYAVQVQLARDWPSPIAPDTLTVPAGATVHVPFAVTVPDSAAAGSVPLTIHARVPWVAGVDSAVAGALDVRPLTGAPATPRAFAVRSARNPVVGTPRLALTLPAATRVRVELLDVAGRFAHPAEERTLEAGVHDWTLAGRGALAPGLYLVRVTAGRERRVLRVAVVR